MTRNRTRGVLLGLSLLVAGCAGGMGAGPEVDYANQAGDGNVMFSWNCTLDIAQHNQLVVNGIVNDTMNASIQDVTVQVVGIGPDGGQVSSGKGSPSQWIVTTMARTPFEVTVNTTGTETQFNLYYSYRVGAGITYASLQQNAQMNACPGLRR